MIAWLKKHYHWVIAVVVLLQLAIHGGAANNLSGLHLIPVTQALDITRTEYSLAGSIKSIVGVFSTLFSGVMILKFGYRTAVGVGLALSGAAYVLLSGMDSYWTFLAGFALLGVTNGVCTTSGATRIVSAWFHKHRGMVLGLVTAATGIGGSIMSIIQSYAIENISWRASYMTVAVLMFVIAVLVFLLVRNHPTNMGLLPYGDGEQISHKKGKTHQDLWSGFTMKKLMKRPTFYLMLAGTFLTCMCIYLAFSFVAPHLQDCGLSAAQASTLHSIMLLLLSGTKFLAGTLSDTIGAKKVTMLCIGFSAVGLAMLASVNGFGFAAAAVVVYSMALPIVSVTIPLLANALFGYQAQAEYTGVFMSMISAASIVAGPLSNAAYDHFGSYRPVFYAAAALSVLLLGLYWLMYRLAEKDQKKMQQAEAPVQN